MRSIEDPNRFEPDIVTESNESGENQAYNCLISGVLDEWDSDSSQRQRVDQTPDLQLNESGNGIYLTSLSTPADSQPGRERIVRQTTPPGPTTDQLRVVTPAGAEQVPVPPPSPEVNPAEQRPAGSTVRDRTDAQGNRLGTETLDANGRVIQRTNIRNGVLQSRETITYNPDGSAVSQHVDATARLTMREHLTPQGKVSQRLTYGADGAVDSHQRYQYQLRPDGSVASRRTTDGQNRPVRSIEYDQQGRQSRSQELNVQGRPFRTDTYQYGADGTCIGTGTNAAGQRLDQSHYDAQDRLTSISYFEADGRALSYTDTYNRDTNGRMQTVRRLNGDGTTDNFSYNYNAAGQNTSVDIRSQNGVTEQHDFGPNGRETRVTATNSDAQGGRSEVQWQFNAAGNLAAATTRHPDERIQLDTYNPQNEQVQRSQWVNASGQPIENQLPPPQANQQRWGWQTVYDQERLRRAEYEGQSGPVAGPEVPAPMPPSVSDLPAIPAPHLPEVVQPAPTPPGGNDAVLPHPLRDQLRQMTPAQLQEFIQRSARQPDAAAFLRGLQEAMNAPAGSGQNAEAHTQLRQNVMAALVDSAQRLGVNGHTPEVFSQISNMIVATLGGRELLRERMIRESADHSNAALRMLLSVSSGADAALARRAQETILSVASVPNPLQSLMTGERRLPLTNLINPLTPAVRDDVTRAVFEASGRDLALLPLATSIALNGETVSGGDAASINRISSAAREGNENALRLMSTLARGVDERTATNSAGRLALNGLIDIATVDGAGARPQIDAALSRLASGRSEYLRDQVWSGLSNQAPARPRALAVMTAIATGSDTVPTNLSEALGGLPDLIRRNPADPGAQRAAEILIRAAQLNTTGNEAQATQSLTALRGLVAGLTEANGQSSSILQTVLAGAIANDQGASMLGVIGSRITSEPVRRQFVDLIRTQLREAPEEDTEYQQRSATALSSLVNGFATRHIARDGSNASTEHVIQYLGVPSAELLARSRDAENSAQLELEAYGLAAIRHLQPTQAVDRQVFARIAATHLAGQDWIDQFGLTRSLTNPRRDEGTNASWNSLLSQFAPPPNILYLSDSRYNLEQWRTIQTELQGLLVDQLRQQANSDSPLPFGGSGGTTALIGLIPPLRPVALMRDRTTEIMEARDRAVTTAVRGALTSLSTDPQRQLQILTQLLERQGREQDNSALLRIAAGVASRTNSVPAPVMASLNSWLRYAIESNAPDSSSGSYGRQARYLAALSGAATLMAAGREVDPAIVTAGRNAVGQLITQLAGRDQNRRQTLRDTINELSPFLTPEQARTLAESR